eukprot:354169-Chlamydomonas_euryale.AAC.12
MSNANWPPLGWVGQPHAAPPASPPCPRGALHPARLPARISALLKRRVAPRTPRPRTHSGDAVNRLRCGDAPVACYHRPGVVRNVAADDAAVGAQCLRQRVLRLAVAVLHQDDTLAAVATPRARRALQQAPGGRRRCARAAAIADVAAQLKGGGAQPHGGGSCRA